MTQNTQSECDHVFAWKNLFVNNSRISKCIYCGITQKHEEEF